MSFKDFPSYNARYKFESIARHVAKMEQRGASEEEIAAYILSELHRANLTLQMFEDWRNGYGN